MSDQRFQELYPPLRALHEHLNEELARNPYIAPADPAAQDDDRLTRGDDRTDDSPPPRDSPASRLDGPR